MIERVNGAKARMRLLEMKVATDHPEYDTVRSTFSFNDGKESEAEAMGRCIQEVMESDAIYLDKYWELSNGCRLEKLAAQIYGIKILYCND